MKFKDFYENKGTLEEGFVIQRHEGGEKNYVNKKKIGVSLKQATKFKSEKEAKKFIEQMKKTLPAYAKSFDNILSIVKESEVNEDDSINEANFKGTHDKAIKAAAKNLDGAIKTLDKLSDAIYKHNNKSEQRLGSGDIDDALEEVKKLQKRISKIEMYYR